jgi:hypothetical protein
LPYLEDYDFVQTTQATILKDDAWHVYAGDLTHPTVRKRMLTGRFNFFGPTTVAHRLDSYQALPHGWRTKPKKIQSDLHMWRQWLAHKPAKFKSLYQVTSLHLGSPTRIDMTTEERCTEMLYWLNRIEEDSTRFYQFAQTQLLACWSKQISDNVFMNTRFTVVFNKLYNLLTS